jgi:hypothetical protein
MYIMCMYLYARRSAGFFLHPNTHAHTHTYNKTHHRKFQVEAGTTIDSLLVAAVDREGNFVKSDKARDLR